MLNTIDTINKLNQMAKYLSDNAKNDLAHDMAAVIRLGATLIESSHIQEMQWQRRHAVIDQLNSELMLENKKLRDQIERLKDMMP